MSYTALYRKYRPNVFAGVIGQEHIVRTLKNQMITGRVSHAYLFCGTRGTGKTSTAKIFARAINCTQATTDGEPCNVCESCLEVLSGRSVNVIEIDAASNNGVDNIRDIREEVKYPPTRGRFKVYIIDEVHMLSGGAFNALLKTLEEPPAHVIFILATTDPQKVPPTILSRCQRFDFRRITTKDIAEALGRYLGEEGIKATEEALEYVARLGDGSMRDALSILDQCVAFFSGEEITLEKVQSAVGAVDDKVFFQMTQYLMEKQAKGMLAQVGKILLLGSDISQFVAQWVNHLRNLLVVKTVSDASGILDLSEEKRNALLKQCESVSPEELFFYVQEVSKLQGELRYAANPRVVLEVFLLRLSSPVQAKDVTAMAARLSSVERQLKEGVSVAGAVSMPQEKAEAPKKKKPPALPEDRKDAVAKWDTVKSGFSAILKSQLLDVELGHMEDEYLYLVCPYEALIDILEKSMEEIGHRLEEVLGKSFALRGITKEKYDAWRFENYDVEEEANNEDFESLLSSYVPDADFCD